jgi:CHAD domain-containing protein
MVTPRMADGKWIDHLKANTPLTDAAQKVLLARLQVVRNYLPKALHEAEQNSEYVHQLRVGTRRADAALRIFAPCLPDKVWRKARKRLKRIRRAAGAARDLDVFAIHVLERQSDQPAQHQPGLDFLVGHTLGQRTQAQTQLQETGLRDGNGLEEFVRDLVLSIRPPADASGDATLLTLARPLLSNLLNTLHEKASGDLKEYPHLHQVRIAGKRLRYAMEVFAPCFEPAFRQRLYPLVEQMQEILGGANDSYVGAQRIVQIRAYVRTAWSDGWKRLAPGVEAALQSFRKRLPAERRRFLRWWKHWQEHGEHEMHECLYGPTHTDA